MHLINCEHPVRIERYGEVNYVPCGKCSYCRNNRAIGWTERLRLEMQTHKYCIFGTLTYADMFVPKMFFDAEQRAFIVPDGDTLTDNFFSDIDSGLYVYYPYMNSKELSYVMSRQKRDGYIPYLRKSDAQLYFKRVRRRIDYHVARPLIKINPENEQKIKKELRISYAICGEYGESVYRSHFHFIIMFDSAELAKKMRQILRSCWQFGNCRFRWVSDEHAAKYVAKYVNGLYNLPSCYKVKEFRPFLLVSKADPIGIGKIDKKEIQRIFYERSPTMRVEDVAKGQYKERPLWRFLANRLFPSFSGYLYLPNWLRVRLLNFATSAPTIEGFYGLVNKFMLECPNSSMAEYFRLRFKHNEFAPNDYDVISEYYNYGHDIRSTYQPQLKDSALNTLYYAAKRIEYNMVLFNVPSIAAYVEIINNYHHNVEQYKLANQMEFERKYIVKHPDEHYLIDLSSNRKLACLTADVAPVLNKIQSDIEHSSKNRRKYEYLAAHPEYCYIKTYDDFSEGFVGNNPSI